MNPHSDLPFWLLDQWTCFQANGPTSMWLFDVGPSFVRPGRELPGTGCQLPCRSYPERDWPRPGWAKAGRRYPLAY